MSQNLSSAAVVIGALRANICCLAIFFKIDFFEKFFQEITIRVSNNLHPDQDRHSAGPDLGPNCL